MARSSQHVQVGKRKLELSNLDKVLYPEAGYLKAEVVEYYLKIAPTILKYLKGRPLTLVRWPNGVDSQPFFQKNKPDWTPNWIESIQIGNEEKMLDYILAAEEATLVWLANLAALELHVLHAHKPNLDKPDYIVFDLDPPENYPFDQVIHAAVLLREHLEDYGYHPFVKTSGGKGVHILAPLEPKGSFDDVFQAAKDIATPYVEANKDFATLKIKKDARGGRMLIDIYRNRPLQTIIAAYSLRGKPGAPVSMPLTWENLENTESPLDWNIRTGLDQLMAEGDAWEGMAAYGVTLHSQRKRGSGRKSRVKKSDKYKTPEQLDEYERKRDFEKTNEPAPAADDADGNAFVVHRHHASRLHYDLRLQMDGALKSWAVPRGLPPRPGIKRLAVNTEDHPLEYLTFEGVIPKGQYGAGPMWRFANGRFEITKEKKDGYYFMLHSPQMAGEYRIYHTRDKDWLLERVDKPQFDWLNEEVRPMLSGSRKSVPSGGEYLYEVKWDGIRAMITLDEGEMTIRSRNMHLLNDKFPELMIPEKGFRATNAVFDAEIVCLDAKGRPSFQHVISRMHAGGEKSIERAQRKYPAHCYIFDCLFLDGRPLINEPLERRREWMADSIRKDTPYRPSESLADGEALFDAAKEVGLEGIMAKEKGGKYQPGKRSDAWLKVKVRSTADCVIVGYTAGQGNRESVFGAVQVAEIDQGVLTYRGGVGTGFNDKMLKSLYREIQALKEVSKPFDHKVEFESKITWIEPELYCEVQYASITPNGTYREPVFIRLRPDLKP